MTGRPGCVTGARQRKADRLVAAALAAGVTAEQVAADADLRDRLVTAAGVREPSLDTWRLVVNGVVAAEGPRRLDLAGIVADIYAVHARVAAGGSCTTHPKFHVHHTPRSQQ